LSTISWALNYVPWWVWPLAVVVIAAATFQFWAPVWALMPKWLKAVILAVFALATAFTAGKWRGAKDERDQRAKADANALKNRKEVDDDVANNPRADVDRDLDQWMRD
jgi:membrane protein implicated in regulation of membrane protease activity